MYHYWLEWTVSMNFNIKLFMVCIYIYIGGIMNCNLPNRKWTMLYYDFNTTDHERMDILVYKFTVSVQNEKKFCLTANAVRSEWYCKFHRLEFFLVLLIQMIIITRVCVCMYNRFFVVQIYQIYTLVVGTVPVIIKCEPAIQ